MTSTRPYLIRAIHQWACDNSLTPHLVVDATHPDVHVPLEHVRDGQIVLNVHPQAVHTLELGDEWILFSARFAGAARQVQFPVAAVQAIYARENGQGIFFPADEEPAPDDGAGEQDASTSGKPSRPSLKVIK